MAIDFLSSMGVGSGINTEEVVSALVEAQRAPVQTSLDRSKERAESKISGYGIVKSAVLELKNVFDELDDVRGVASFTVTSSDKAAISAVSSESAVPGMYEVVVSNLATRDTWTSNGFESTSTSLNGGTAFDLTVTVGGSPQTLSILAPTPQAVVDSINDSGLGLTAGIIDTGVVGPSRYIISVSGQTGSDNAFTLSSSSEELSFADQRSSASDASLTVGGVSITRSTNSVSDAIPGVTLSLIEETAPDTVQIIVDRDIDSFKQKIKNLVDTYNDVTTVFDSLSSREDADDDVTGALAADSTFRYLKNQIRELFSGQSSTASGDYAYFASIGVEMKKDGSLSFNETQFNGALSDGFNDVVTMLTADTNDQSIYGDSSRGLAGDAKVFLDKLLRVTGTVTTSLQRGQEQLTAYEADLEDLDRRMEVLKERYINQFSSMQQVVDQMNSTRDYLKRQFDAMNGGSD